VRLELANAGCFHASNVVTCNYNDRTDLTSASGVATKCYKCYISRVSRTITQRQLRNDSSAVLREVQAGQTLVVTRNGVPIAELRPLPPRRFVPRAVIADAARRAPRVDAARLRADLDSVVDSSVHG
jgi:prevent-host-death family protein